MNNNRKMREKRIKQCFDQLYEQCKKKGSYSAKEVAQELGFYEEIKEWIAEKEEWADMWEFCQEICALNASLDGQYYKLKPELALKYMLEGCAQFREHYSNPEVIERKIRGCPR